MKINLKFISFHSSLLMNRNVRKMIETYGYEGFYIYFNTIMYMANNDGFYSVLDDILYLDIAEQTNSEFETVEKVIRFLMKKGILQMLTIGDKKVIYDITLYENALRVIKKYKWKPTKNVNHLITMISNDIEKDLSNILDNDEE